MVSLQIPCSFHFQTSTWKSSVGISEQLQPVKQRRMAGVLWSDSIVRRNLGPRWWTWNYHCRVCGEFADQTEAHAGCRTWSVGYHGNNGSIYEEDDQYLYTTSYKFGLGNKVGCGVDYEKQVYFFTRDGLVSCMYWCYQHCFSLTNLRTTCLADNKSEIIFRKLYPLISHSGGACNVSVNFGQSDFVWRGAEKLKEPSLRFKMNTSRKELYERPLSRVWCFVYVLKSMLLAIIWKRQLENI